MGQNVTVVATRSSSPGVVRFETNRPLTGMGHEAYRSVEDIVFDRPPDRLARRLFALGGIERVHVNGNVVTVRLADLGRVDTFKDEVEDLFRFYADDDPPPEVESE